jgi:hypothetical protein
VGTFLLYPVVIAAGGAYRKYDNIRGIQAAKNPKRR